MRGTLLAVLLTVAAASICVRVEVLNAMAGGVMSKTEEGKWRAPIGGTFAQSQWRKDESYARSDPTLITRPLTPAENREMVAFVRRADANEIFATSLGVGVCCNT